MNKIKTFFIIIAILCSLPLLAEDLRPRTPISSSELGRYKEALLNLLERDNSLYYCSFGRSSNVLSPAKRFVSDTINKLKTENVSAGYLIPGDKHSLGVIFLTFESQSQMERTVYNFTLENDYSQITYIKSETKKLQDVVVRSLEDPPVDPPVLIKKYVDVSSEYRDCAHASLLK